MSLKSTVEWAGGRQSPRASRVQGPPGSMQKRRKGLEGKYVNGLMGREEWEGEERGGKGREEAEGERE